MLPHNDVQSLQGVEASVGAAVVNDHNGIVNLKGLKDNVPQGFGVIVDRYDNHEFYFTIFHI